MLSICAVIAVRNESQYLRVLLPVLANQGIDVAIIDNGSTDESHELYSHYLDNPIILVENTPYNGYFSLQEQLAVKQKIYNNIKHDWVIHHDADEFFEHRKPTLTLRDAIQEADENNFNVINFDEFVFLPEPATDYCTKNYYREILRYYFFEPQKNRLNRAWKRSSYFNNTTSGGHILFGDQLSIYPLNHILRHYIVLSSEHAIRKYLHRTFSEQEVSIGWHKNRLNFTRENLALPVSSQYLFQLPAYDSKEFRRDIPALKHYWEWTRYPI